MVFDWLRRLLGGGGALAGPTRERRSRHAVPQVPLPVFFPPPRRFRAGVGPPAPDDLPPKRRRWPRRARYSRLEAVFEPTRLARFALPALETPEDVAAALGITMGRLKWLTFPVDDPAHYVMREVPKRSGGTRLLCAPKAQTRAAQDWIRREILDRLPANDCSHGFRRGRSIVTNAREHVGQQVVVNLDLEGCFPSISFATVDGLFESLGYSKAVAWHLAMLCTCRYGGHLSRRSLPQGAPTSPGIANAVCWKLDRRLSALAAKAGGKYTRYADDLTFSGDGAFGGGLNRFLPLVGRIVAEEGFRLNARKMRVMRRASRQEVTGVVVNDRPGLRRREVRQLRAILHNCRVHGAASQNAGQDPLFRERLRGRIALVRMVNPEQGGRLQQVFDAVAW
jgi:retron-type reverse transcriptase